MKTGQESVRGKPFPASEKLVSGLLAARETAWLRSPYSRAARKLETSFSLAGNASYTGYKERLPDCTIGLCTVYSDQ